MDCRASPTSSISLHFSAISAAEAGAAIWGHAIFWCPEGTHFAAVKAFLWFEGEISGLPHALAIDTTSCNKARYGKWSYLQPFQNAIGMAGAHSEGDPPVRDRNLKKIQDLQNLKGATRMRNKQKGFSLIELLIVVAIILIIAAIAIPNLLRSKMAANEASAVSALRTLNTTEVLYSTTYNTLSPDLASLGPDAGGLGTAPTSAGADLLDSVMAGGVAGAAPASGAVTIASKSGYAITYTPTTAGGVTSSYTISARPITFNGSGIRSFFTDQTGVIRANSANAAA